MQGERDRATDNLQPLLLAHLPTGLTYIDLVRLVEELDWSGGRHARDHERDNDTGTVTVNDTHEATRHWRLPGEISHRIVDYLVVEGVQHEQVQVIGCSSTDGSHPLPTCLSPDEDTWWISAANTMPEGKGHEYVEFRLHPSTLCRLTCVSIKIPPLPAGPLSVRDFVIKAPIPRGRSRTREFLYVPLTTSSSATQQQQQPPAINQRERIAVPETGPDTIGDSRYNPPDTSEEWEDITPVYRVHNVTGYQNFF